MSNLTTRAVTAAIYLGLASAVVPAGAITLGQSNTFEGATTEGWSVAQQHPEKPRVEINDGPGGVGDGYMLLTSVGTTSQTGAGSRMAVNAGEAWFGNYLGAGVTAIELDARNFGDTTMHLRLAFSTTSGGDYWVSSAAQVLPGEGTWTHLVFTIDAASLTGPGNLATTLGNVGDLRIFHNTVASFSVGSQPVVTASLGVDNITAVGQVPEPATVWMWAAAAGMLGLRTAAKRRAPSA